MEPHGRLVAWRAAHALAVLVYRLTQEFPASERYGLTSQARRAAFSGAAKIVEGSARASTREFRRHLDIARSSLKELGYAFRLARDVGYLSQDDWQSAEGPRHRAAWLVWRLRESLA